MKLYEFDGVDASLELIPLAARRALDALGVKLSLAGFHSLDLQDRTALARAGSGTTVDKKAAQRAIERAEPPGTRVEPTLDPGAQTTPPHVREALGSARLLDDKIWQQLSPLDRYALWKVAEKNRPERVAAAYEEIVGGAATSTHVRPQGGVHMVSISEKEITRRSARAECWLTLSADAFQRLTNDTAPKGDVLGTARVAGLMALKKTSDLIPLCHPLAVLHAEIDFEERAREKKLRVVCSVTVEARTGVEMEAMVGANIAALTIYDMLKSLDRGMVVGPARLIEKSGGRSGTFTAEDPSGEKMP